MTTEQAVAIGLFVGSLAVVIWTGVFVRTLFDWRHGDERRTSWVLMSGTAMLAAIGSLSSSIGYGIQSGVIVVDIPQPLFSFVASVGRGALLAAALIVLTHRARPRGVR